MSAKNNNKSNLNKVITLKEFVAQCLSKWLWFVISVVFCLIAAIVYLWSTPKIFQRDSTVMIKQDDRRNSASFTNQLQNMGSLDLFGTVSDVQNEILCMQSTDIMLETVRRLNLDYIYSSRKFLPHKGVLYGDNLPVKVFVENIGPEQELTMTVVIRNGRISVTDLKTSVNGVEYLDDASYECVPDSTVMTLIGAVRVNVLESDPDDRTIYVSRCGYHSSVRQLQDELSFNLANNKSSLIKMSCKDIVPARAEDILNTIVVVYNESWVRDKNLLAISTSNFINERVSVIEDELGDVDASLSSYKRSNNIADVNISAAQDISQASASDNNLRQLTNEMYMVRYIRDYMSKDIDGFHLLPSGLGLSSISINSQIEAFNNLLLQRDNIARHSSNDSPLVREKDSELATMHAAILTGLDNEQVRLQNSIDAERSNQNKYMGRIAQTPTIERDLRSISRQQDVKEQLYLFLLQKREENELTQAFTAYNTRIVSTPYGSFSPITPKRNQILLLALFIGLFVPFVVIYYKNVFKTTVRGRKDLEKLSAPFAGEIPLVPGKKRSRSKDDAETVVVKSIDRSVIGEAFRVVRSNIEFMAGQNRKQVIMLTSFNPGSGKTFISCNLAAVMAIKGKKTIVIDLDMRHASLSKLVGKQDKGLSNYLAGFVEDCPVVASDQEGMDVIPVGPTPPNPSELLYSERLKTLIDRLRAQYDYVFLDCPPVDIVADASIVATLADATVFVVRAGLMERDMLPELDKLYSEGKLPDMAVILNGTENMSGHYGYRYGYHYRHYGYYNYGASDRK